MPVFKFVGSRKVTLLELRTGRNGVGLALTTEYAPLKPEVPEGADPTTTIDSHFATLTITPRFTLGHKMLRVWVAAGGGVVMQRTATTIRDTTSTDTSYETAAVGEASLELHLFQSGGLSIAGNYTHSFGNDIEARLYSVFGGLVFTFR